MEAIYRGSGGAVATGSAVVYGDSGTARASGSAEDYEGEPTMLTMNRALATGLLNNAKAAGGILAGAVVRLAKQMPGNPSARTKLDTITECDFPGYAPSAAVVWSDPVNTQDGAQLNGDVKTFRADATVPNGGQSAMGYYVTTPGANPLLLLCELFDEGRLVSEADDAVSIAPVFALGNVPE